MADTDTRSELSLDGENGNGAANILDGGGGGGNDTLAGGAGNDIYVVDSFFDVIIELNDEGLDTVKTGLSAYTLPDHFENLELTGTTALEAYGNALDNRLVLEATPSPCQETHYTALLQWNIAALQHGSFTRSTRLYHYLGSFACLSPK